MRHVLKHGNFAAGDIPAKPAISMSESKLMRMRFNEVMKKRGAFVENQVQRHNRLKLEQQKAKK